MYYDISKDPRNKSELEKCLCFNSVNVERNYISLIEKMRVAEPEYAIEGISCRSDKKEKFEMGENVRFSELSRFVYDEDENIQDKLISVYQAVSAYESCKIIMLIRSCRTGQKIYFGVSSNTDEIGLLDEQLKTLKDNFKGNFPGVKFKDFTDIKGEGNMLGISSKSQRVELLKSVFRPDRNIAAVTGIPALKSDKIENNQDFIQGIEKVMDAIAGQDVDILIIADSLTTEQIDGIKNYYYNLSSQISPHIKAVKSCNYSKGSNESISISVQEGGTKQKSHTVGKSKGNNWSVSFSPNVGYNDDEFSGSFGLPFGLGNNNSDQKSDTTSESENNSVQMTGGGSTSETEGDSIQIEYEDKAVKSIADKIDKQIERLNECEDFGGYDCGVYILADDYSQTVSTSTLFESIMRGKESSVEATSINIWKKTRTPDITQIKEYLARFNHPEFQFTCMEGVLPNRPVTPATIINGRELVVQMGLPRKSVSGLPVVKTTRFGRNVLYIDDSVQPKKELILGNIFHMNEKEESFVSLNMDSLTSHVFVTGSTGSGKSTAVYKMINGIVPANNKRGNDISFMVIEPAKGEYKAVFGGRKDVEVYGTNLNETKKILKINPFSFCDNIHVLEHIDKLICIFNACWPMYAAMPAVLKDAIERAYSATGWDLVKSVCKYKEEQHYNVYPSFSDVLEQIGNVMNESKYSSDAKGDYSGALMTRVRSLTNGINGLIFSSNEISSCDLFDKNVIIDLSRVSSDETKSLIMGMLIIKQQEYRMSNKNGINEPLKHITVLEEAHNILKRTSKEQSAESANLVGKSVEMISSAIAEMRTYGEGFIIVDQSPESVDISAVKNTNTKIIMRLPDISDREQIGKSAGMNDEQIRELSKLKTGVAAVYQNNWVEPVLCQIDNSALKSYEYFLPEEYKPEWNEDDDIIKEILKSLVSRYTDSYNDFHDSLLPKVMRTSLPGIVKVSLINYSKSDDENEKDMIFDDVIYTILFDENIWRKSLEYYDAFDKWVKFIKNNIKPVIMNFENKDLYLMLRSIIKKQYNIYSTQNNLSCKGMVEKLMNELNNRLSKG